MLDPNETDAYRIARRVAPHLFKEEVDPVKFLRSTDFNPWETAAKITNYWKHRKEVFGDRWLMPLAQSQKYGALKPMDLKMLEVGYVIAYDDYIIYDFSRLTKFAGASTYTDEELEQSRARIMMYYLTVTASEHAQRKGKKLLILAEGVTTSKLWKAKRIWPFRAEGFYLVQHQYRLRDSITGYWLRFFLDGCKRFYSKVPKLILASTKEEMCMRLLDAGFPLEIIPAKLGGPWSYSRGVKEWMDDLARKDDERYERMLSTFSPRGKSRVTLDSPCLENKFKLSLNCIDYRGNSSAEEMGTLGEGLLLFQEL